MTRLNEMHIDSFKRSKTIFAQFENDELKKELEKCAIKKRCDIYWGKPDSSDIIAIPHFISILDRNITGKEAWKNYLKYLEETGDNTPCIIIDNRNDLGLPKNIDFVGIA